MESSNVDVNEFKELLGQYKIMRSKIFDIIREKGKLVADYDEKTLRIILRNGGKFFDDKVSIEKDGTIYSRPWLYKKKYADLSELLQDFSTADVNQLFKEIEFTFERRLKSLKEINTTLENW